MTRESAEVNAREPTECDVSLVIPVHHCHGDLRPLLRELHAFRSAGGRRCEIVIIDDHGTHPDAPNFLRQFAACGDVRLIVNDRNRGKGYSVRVGMLAASGRYRVFRDADLAYPLTEVWKIVAELEKGADMAIACRALPESQYEVRPTYIRYIYTRHVLSRAFNALVRTTLLPGVLDTQAGLKGFTAVAAQSVFGRAKINGFGFDLECLYVARHLGLRVIQVPVRFIYDNEPSTVRFMKDGITMLGDLIRLWWRGVMRAYAHAPARPRTSSDEFLMDV